MLGADAQLDPIAMDLVSSRTMGPNIIGSCLTAGLKANVSWACLSKRSQLH